MKKKIVVNYLDEVKELFEENKIDFVDYFKLFSLNEDLSGLAWCIQKRPVMFHGIIGKQSSFGDKNLLSDTDVMIFKEVLKKTNTPYISGHICTKNIEQSECETLEAIRKNIEDFRKAFNMDIVLENIPYREHYLHCLYLLNPEVISKIVYENDIKFLFDISHARKAAVELNMTFDEYVEKLPMDRVIEIHLAGMVYNDDGTAIDAHAKMNKEDYEFLEIALQKYLSLEYITLEYGSIVLRGKTEEEMLYPVAKFGKVNQIVKGEVYKQLIRIKKIINKVENKEE